MNSMMQQLLNAKQVVTDTQTDRQNYIAIPFKTFKLIKLYRLEVQGAV